MNKYKEKMRSILIKGGLIIDPKLKKEYKSDLLIESGKIKEIKSEIVKRDDMKVVDAKNLWMTAGLIDMHSHLREPGFEHKETIETGSKSAASGGFTTICAMANSNPVNDNANTLQYILEKIKTEAVINVLPIGALSKSLKGEELADLEEMVKLGLVAFSDDGSSIEDNGKYRSMLEYASMFGLPILEHAESLALSRGVMNEGIISTKLGLIGNPSFSEELMVARAAIYSEHLSIPLHICHLSTEGGLRIIRDAQSRGVAISAEVTPHHFTLTEEAVIGYNTNAKMAPPLRSERDRESLIDGLADGTIGVIATDHAPHADYEKGVEFDKAPFGVIGFETALPLGLRLVDANRITRLRLIESLTTAPAGLLKLDAGKIEVGAEGDITLIDPIKEWKYSKNVIVSKSENSPFIDSDFKGRAVMTIVSGKIVYNIIG